MPINNISDWLSFLNERIASYEAMQNSHFTLIGVILGFVLAMVGITVTTAKGMDLIFIYGQLIIIAGLIIIDFGIFIIWRIEGKSSNQPYQNALEIRAQILEGTLTNTNDIYQQCIHARIFVI